MKKRVVVIGAGVSGLSSALAIQQRHSKDDIHVTIMADRFLHDNVSMVAAGIFRFTWGDYLGLSREEFLYVSCSSQRWMYLVGKAYLQ